MQAVRKRGGGGGHSGDRSEWKTNDRKTKNKEKTVRSAITRRRFGTRVADEQVFVATMRYIWMDKQSTGSRQTRLVIINIDSHVVLSLISWVRCGVQLTR